MGTKNFLIDTNILIYGLAGIKPWSNLLSLWLKKKQLIISSIVVAEFLTGATKNEAQIFQMYLDRFGSLAVDTEVAKTAAFYKKSFLKKGRKLRLADCLIAASCFLTGATLVTFNLKDYPMTNIKKFKT